MVGAVKKDGHYGPEAPAPDVRENDEPCEGTIEGTSTLSGTIRFKGDCCCPKLKTETLIIDTGPIGDAALVTLLQATTQDYEANNYLVLAHSLLDAGGSRVIGLTIGWYE